MRRIVITSITAAALTCAAVYIVGANHALAQSKSKTAAAKMAMPAGYGNSDAITGDELKIYDYFLASDELEGRNFPSRGYDTAALYVASHLAEWGLKPGGSTSGHERPSAALLHAHRAGDAGNCSRREQGIADGARRWARWTGRRRWWRRRTGRARRRKRSRRDDEFRIRQGLDNRCGRPVDAAARRRCRST